MTPDPRNPPARERLDVVEALAQRDKYRELTWKARGELALQGRLWASAMTMARLAYASADPTVIEDYLERMLELQDEWDKTRK